MSRSFALFVCLVLCATVPAFAVDVQTTLTGADISTTGTFEAEYFANLEALSTNSAGRFSTLVTSVSGDVTTITFTIDETLDTALPPASDIYDELMNLYRYGSTTAFFDVDTYNWTPFTTAWTHTCDDATQALVCPDDGDDESNGSAETLLIAGCVFVAWIVFLVITLELCLRYNSQVGEETHVTITNEDKV